jgi:hypothetical protein
LKENGVVFYQGRVRSEVYRQFELEKTLDMEQRKKKEKGMEGVVEVH